MRLIKHQLSQPKMPYRTLQPTGQIITNFLQPHYEIRLLYRDYCIYETSYEIRSQRSYKLLSISLSSIMYQCMSGGTMVKKSLKKHVILLIIWIIHLLYEVESCWIMSKLTFICKTGKVIRTKSRNQFELKKKVPYCWRT